MSDILLRSLRVALKERDILRELVGRLEAEVERLERIEREAGAVMAGVEITGNDPPYFGVATTVDWPIRLARLRAAFATPQAKPQEGLC